ncbi:MAG: sigma 54-interacting transcriptional regulator [Sandaracinaceae bacterium]|nr:sigma 54-interacting transcriptional regulator [Sandaracinaceae bacterium]
MSEAPTVTRTTAVGRRVLLVLDASPRALSLPETGQLHVGRSASSADLVLDDPSISRLHVRLTLEPGRVLATDLESKNGTRLGGRALAPSIATELPFGVVLEIGDVPVVLQPGHGAIEQWVERLAPERQDAAAGAGTAMQRVRRILARVAPDDVSVLLLGETGAGKELLAEALHQGSPRARGPLLRLNCAAMGESLFESELFGHEKGAFTGAVAQKAGLLESAHGGTVFLDEIGELPLGLQSKLLRAIEQRVVRRVGGRVDLPIDVRFVSATNRDLEAESARGTFRSDLYFRLSGFTVRVPPLRERLDELPELAASILTAAATERRITAPRLSTASLAALRAHPWPGNVRELKNVLVQALILSDGRVIEPSDLPLEEMRARAKSLADATPRASVAEAPLPAMAPASAHPSTDPGLRERIEAALQTTAGNQTEAARLLGISRRTLIHRLEELGIARPRKR